MRVVPPASVMGDANVHAQCLQPRVLLRHGCLASGAVSAAAYDAAQQTLVFALQDGQLLVCGGDGEQTYLASACEVASRFLLCLAPSQYLLRVSVQSEIELWSLRDLKLVASTLWPGADITAVCALGGTSFCLVGTEDGAVQPVCLRGSVVSVRASVLECGTPVVALAVQPEASDSARVLVACASGLVVLLDLESRLRVLEVQAGGQLTRAAWVDSATFVTAHAGGELRCWSLPRDAADAWRAPPARPVAVDLVGELVLEAPVMHVQVLHTNALVVSLDNSTACLVSVVQEGSRALGIAPLTLPAGFAGWIHAGWKSRFLLALAAQSSVEGTCVQVHDGRPERLAWEAMPLGWPAASVTCAQMLCDASALLELLYESSASDGDSCGALAAQVLRRAARVVPALGAARLLVSGHSDGRVRLSSASGAALVVVSTLTVGERPVAHVHADQMFCAACTSREVSVFALDATLSWCGGASLETDALCVAVSGTAGAVAVGCAGGGLATWCLPSFTSGGLLRPLPSESVVAVMFVAGETEALLLALGSGCSVAAIQPATGNILSLSKPKAPAIALALFALDQSCAPVLGLGAPSGPCSEDSGDELGDVPAVAETLVVCSTTALRLQPLVPSSRHAEPELEYRFDSPVRHAQIFVAPGGACVACLDEAFTVHVLEAAALLPVCSVSFFDIADERCLGDSALVFAAGLDGHALAVFLDSRGQRMSEAMRLELLEEFSAPEAPPEPPVLWDRSRAAPMPEAAAEDDTPCDAQSVSDAAPAKRNILAGGLGGLRDTVRARATQALKHVGAPGFKQRRRLTDDDYDALLPPPAAPPPAPLVRTRLEVVDGGRGELLGSQGPALRSVDDIRRKYGRPARPAAEDAATTAGVMGRNLQKLNERGEKLAIIQEKTALMESQAADFAASAKKLREQQEARTLFGLFS